MESNDNPQRLPNGRFQPGSSGNPSGRPKTDSALIRAKLAEKGEAVAQQVLNSALSGDMQACKMVLDRITPTLKPQAAPVRLDNAKTNSLEGLARSFIEAAAGGQLPPDIAAQLVASVGTLARVIEVHELKERLDSLEHIISEKRL